MILICDVSKKGKVKVKNEMYLLVGLSSMFIDVKYRVRFRFRKIFLIIMSPNTFKIN